MIFSQVESAFLKMSLHTEYQTILKIFYGQNKNFIFLQAEEENILNEIQDKSSFTNIHSCS